MILGPLQTTTVEHAVQQLVTKTSLVVLILPQLYQF